MVKAVLSSLVLFAAATLVFTFDASKQLDFVQSQAEVTWKGLPSLTEYPDSTQKSGEDWHWHYVKAGGWTCGFYASSLWKLSQVYNSTTWADRASSLIEGIKRIEHDTSTHDVGFMVFYTFGHGYLITQNEAYKQVTLTTATSLSTRYNKVVGCIESWNAPKGHFYVIIDNMMNLELLWWAAVNGGSSEFHDMAVSHADNMIRDCIKADGSSYHLVDYDPNTGKVLKQSNTPQGMEGGVWSRGEAWCIYGFTIAYKYTKFERYLNTAMKCSNYFISHLPPDHVPYWDFFAPHNESRDSSAAAIASSGLIDLAQYVNATMRTTYLNAANAMLSSLSSEAYLANPKTSPAVLLHATGSHPAHSEIDVSLSYGDYYYAEALAKLLKQ